MTVAMLNEVPFSDLLSEPLRNGVYKAKEFHGRGVKVVNMGELFAHDFIGPQSMKRVELSEQEKLRALLLAGDLLFARRSLVLEGAGHCSLVASVPEPTTFESSLIRARLDHRRAEPRFFFYLFRSPLGRGKLASIAARTAVSGIKGSDLASLRLPCPPLNAQKAVASVLGAYDDLIEVNRRRIAVLQEMARRLFDEWFVHFRFPGHGSHSLTNDELPHGWKVAPLAQVAEAFGQNMSPGLSPDESFVHFSYPAFDDARLPTVEAGSSVLSNKICFSGPAVLLGKLNPRIPRVWDVHPRGSLRQIASTEFVVLRPREQMTQSVLYGYCASSLFGDKLRALAQGTSTSHQRARPQDVLQIQLPLPPGDLLAEADAQLAPIQLMVNRLRESNARLRSARDLLLPRLISGDLPVAAAERELEAVA